jgi:serine/arginine repetitive matrix protein 2
MYNGIGLQTARGSGTNGYVQKNLAYVRDLPKQNNFQQQKLLDIARYAPSEKKPNEEILEHEKKRRIEAKVYDWAEKQGLFDKGLVFSSLILY